MSERIFPTFPGNNIECNFTHLANNSTFSNKTTPSFKGNPNFTELKQVIPPLTLFFVQKCTKYQMVCHPCEEKYETSLFKWWFQQRQKCEQNFSFGLNVGAFLNTSNKRHFFDNQRKKNTSKKKTFLLFLLLSSYRFLALRFQKTLPFPLKLSFPLIFFRINAAKFWKCYRFQCFGVWKYFLCYCGKKKVTMKKMRNELTFYYGGVFVRMWWWCYMML